MRMGFSGRCNVSEVLEILLVDFPKAMRHIELSSKVRGILIQPYQDISGAASFVNITNGAIPEGQQKWLLAAAIILFK
jgi:hypothetical protein